MTVHLQMAPTIYALMIIAWSFFPQIFPIETQQSARVCVYLGWIGGGGWGWGDGVGGLGWAGVGVGVEVGG